jgi:uncharacterized protein (DUF849 family)
MLAAAVRTPATAPDQDANQMRRVRGIVEVMGLAIASPDEARAMSGLKGKNEVGF